MLIDIFHDFIKPLVYPKPTDQRPEGDYSKWHDPIECMYAIAALRSDGNFQPADLVTPTFARMKYIIRGTMLYEAFRVHRETKLFLERFVFFIFYHHFTVDVIYCLHHFRAVHNEAIINIEPGVLSPMNATTEYQSFASTLAHNTQRPPDTRISDDGMFITYAGKTLSIAKW